MSKASDYVDKYAEAAMEQMRKYGIPASVTLAQGILESASGQSELSRKGNNHFGIKATSTWLENGGRYLVYTGDKPRSSASTPRSLTATSTIRSSSAATSATRTSSSSPRTIT